MYEEILHHSFPFSQAQRKAFKTFFELGEDLIGLAYKEHIISIREMVSWYHSSYNVQFITYITNDSDSNETVIFGLSKKQVASVRKMVALAEKTIDWYKKLSASGREDFAIDEFSEALAKIKPAIQAITID